MKPLVSAVARPQGRWRLINAWISNSRWVKPFSYLLFNVYGTSSLITLSCSFTGLSLLTLRTRIKRIGSNNSGDNSNRGFSYIIGSWLMEEERKLTVITSYIATFCLTSLKIFRYRGVFGGGLLQFFIDIAILTCFGEACQ